jgi:hypothetical protein
MGYWIWFPRGRLSQASVQYFRSCKLLSLGTWSSCSLSCGSYERMTEWLNSLPRNLGKRWRSEERPAGSARCRARALHVGHVSCPGPASWSRPPSGPGTRRPEVSESSRPRPTLSTQTALTAHPSPQNPSWLFCSFPNPTLSTNRLHSWSAAKFSYQTLGSVVIGCGLTPVKILFRLRLQNIIPGVIPQPLVRVVPTV